MNFLPLSPFLIESDRSNCYNEATFQPTHAIFKEYT